MNRLAEIHNYKSPYNRQQEEPANRRRPILSLSMTIESIAQTLADALEQERAGDPNAALEAFGKAKEELPGSVLLNSNRGLLLERMGRYAEALLSFQAAAQLESNFRDHYKARNLSLIHI